MAEKDNTPSTESQAGLTVDTSNMSDEIKALHEEGLVKLETEAPKGGEDSAPPAPTTEPKPEESEGEKPIQEPKAKEEPKVEKEEPVTEPVVPVAQPSLDEMSGGKYKTPQELKTAIERLSELEEFNKTSIKDPSDYIKKAYELEQAGGNLGLFNKVNSVDIDKLSNEEAISLRHQWESKISASDANYTVRNEYMIDKENSGADSEDDDYAVKKVQFEHEKRVAGINLEKDGNAARDFLGSYKAEAYKAPVIDTEKETADQLKKQEDQKLADIKANDDRIESWKPAVDKAMESFKNREYQINDKGITSVYEIPEDKQAELRKYANELVENVNVPNDPKFHEWLETEIDKQFWATNKIIITKSIAEKARSITDEAWMSESNNPSAKVKEELPETEPDIDEKNLQKIKKIEGFPT